MNFTKLLSIFVFLFILTTASAFAQDLAASSNVVTEDQPVSCTYANANSAKYNYHFYWYKDGSTTPAHSEIDITQPYSNDPVSTLPSSINQPGNWKCHVYFISADGTEYQVDVLDDNIVSTATGSSNAQQALITPQAPGTSDDLVGTLQNANSPVYNYKLEWYKDGSTTPYRVDIDTLQPYTRDPVSVIHSSETQPGDVWELKVVYTDYQNTEYLIDQTSVTIGTTTVTPALSITAVAAPNAGVAPLTTTFTPTVTGGTGPYTYQWDFEDDSVIDSTATAPSFIYTTAATYTARVTVTDSLGATAQTTVPVIVSPVATLNVVANAVPTSGNAPLPVAFTATASAGSGSYTYQWDFEDDGTYDVFTQNPSFTYTTAATYTARVQATDIITTLTATDTVTVTVTTTGGSSGPSFSTSTCPDGDEDESYTCDIDATGNGTVTFTLVSGPSGMTINSSTGVVSWTPDNDGLVTFTVQATDNDGSTTRSFTIDIDEASTGKPDNDDLFVDAIYFLDDEVNQGDMLVGYVSLENDGNEDFEDLVIKMTIDDLGLQVASSEFDLDGDEKSTKELVMNLPNDVEPGYYMVKFTIENEDLRVIRYRDMIINGETTVMTGSLPVVFQENINAYAAPEQDNKINWIGIWFMIFLFGALVTLLAFLLAKLREDDEEEEQGTINITALDNESI